MTSSCNCYELLGVSRSANNAELRKAFRQLSKELHPDTTSLPYEKATRQFQSVCEAYDLLSDPVLRAEYDNSLEKKNNLVSQSTEIDLIKNEAGQFSKSIGVRRPLSGGELFSLLLLIIALILSLTLGLVIGLFKGEDLIFVPSWMIAIKLII